MYTTVPPHVRRLRGRALAASTAVIIALLGPLSMTAAAPTFGASQDTSEAQLGIALMGAGIVIIALGWPLVGILVMLWLARARANADALFGAEHRLTPGWAIGGWFIPVANWFIPGYFVADVVRASNPTGDSLRAVTVWWASWLAAPVALIVGFVSTAQLGYPEGTRILVQCLLATMALFTTSAIALCSVMLTVARWQDERMA